MPANTLRSILRGALVLAALLCTGLQAWGQANYKPLEQGDYNEVEQKIITLRGLEAGVDYALMLDRNQYKGQPGGNDVTELRQDVRLRLDTVFHQDVSLHLTLQPDKGNWQNTNIRQERTDDRTNRIPDGQVTTITARELYLKYRFNPRSAILAGKHELSIGDRRGKVYDGIAPSLTFDCRVGTWCMPFGMVELGPRSGDTLYHWALQYTAWDEVNDGFRSALQVEVFRIIYNETNVPLGKGLGPTVYDPANPLAGSPLPGQQLEPSTGQPIYYDARQQNYFGLRANWEAGQFFWNFDATSNQGTRDYHLYRDPNTGIVGNLDTGAKKVGEHVKGMAMESEIGYRWPNVRLGLRAMSATGDPYEDPNSEQNYLRTVKGYHEITPGTYKGTRLYFNGGDSLVTDGAGLGHSVNNKRLVGFYLDFEDQEVRKLGYSLGLYQLSLNHAIANVDGRLKKEVGVEWDNMLTWFVHKALKFQVEINLLKPAGAFSLNDYTPPDTRQQLFAQTLARMVYSF